MLCKLKISKSNALMSFYSICFFKPMNDEPRANNGASYHTIKFYILVYILKKKKKLK